MAASPLPYGVAPERRARGVLSPPGSAHLTQQRTVALKSRLRQPRHLLAQDAADTVTDGAGLIASSAGTDELARIAGVTI